MKMKKARTKLFLVAVLGLLVLCGSAWAVDGSGLIAHWTLDEGDGTTAYDSAGDNDGTLVNGPTWTTGQIDGALSFDGDDGVYIEGSSGTSSPLNIYNSDITISSWVRIGTGGTIVARAKPYYITYRLGIGSDSKAYINVYRRGAGHTVIRSDEILDRDTWYHIVGVFDRSSDRGYIYVNGILEADDSMPDAPAGNDGLTKIGCRNNVNDMPFNGVIDDVRIYDRALADDQIQQLYLEGLSSYERAVINIDDAIAEKQEALDRIDAALEKEWAAYDALKELLESGDYGDLSRRDIFKAKRRIRFAMRLEKWSKKVLVKSIEKLEDALMALGVEPLDPNLVAHWKFDERHGTTATDSAGDNDGTVYGAEWTTGQIGGALNFDGDGDYVDFGNPESLRITGMITISAWVKPDVIVGDEFQNIVAHGHTETPPGEVFLRITHGQYQIGSWTRVQKQYVVYNIPSEDEGSWIHLVGLYDGSYWRLYRNGIQVSSRRSSTGAVEVNESWAIGAKARGTARFYNGSIDEVMIFNEALSADQIQQLYEDGLGGQGKKQLKVEGHIRSREAGSRVVLRRPLVLHPTLVIE
ncbi:MAG TPA: LamG domain-containing protein [Phycisphaerales bacterium]|nr:LamG domain-containing protein [Phycisphaerales bacterium]